MAKNTFRPILLLAGGIFGGWFFIRYGLPVLFPFLLGAGIALAAEPMVGLLERRLHLKRWLASGIGVGTVFTLMVALLVMVLGLLLRQAGRLTDLVPELTERVRVGMGSLEDWLLQAASSAPDGVRPILTDTVVGFFSDGSAMMEQLTGTVPKMLSKLLGYVTGGVLTFATAVLAAFMFSGKLPKLRQSQKLPKLWQQRYVPAIKGLRHTVLGWLSAQAKLTLVVMGLLAVSFWLLRVPHGFLWAALISLVDALPVLGCGVVLVPWSTICLLQGNKLQGFGILGVYALTWLVRSVLEPRLLGKELGLDPLVTLLAIYAGYRLLGLPGMILAPLLAVVLTRGPNFFAKNPKTP